MLPGKPRTFQLTTMIPSSIWQRLCSEGLSTDCLRHHCPTAVQPEFSRSFCRQRCSMPGVHMRACRLTQDQGGAEQEARRLHRPPQGFGHEAPCLQHGAIYSSQRTPGPEGVSPEVCGASGRWSTAPERPCRSSAVRATPAPARVRRLLGSLIGPSSVYFAVQQTDAAKPRSPGPQSRTPLALPRNPKG